MSQMITIEAAKELAKAFGDKGVGNKETAKELAGAFGDLAQAAENGSLRKLMEALGPGAAASPALAVLTGLFISQTSKERAELMSHLLEIVGRESTQKAIGSASDLANNLMDGADDILTWAENTGILDQNMESLNKKIESLNMMVENAQDKLKRLEHAMSYFVDAFSNKALAVFQPIIDFVNEIAKIKLPGQQAGDNNDIWDYILKGQTKSLF